MLAGQERLHDESHDMAESLRCQRSVQGGQKGLALSLLLTMAAGSGGRHEE